MKLLLKEFQEQAVSKLVRHVRGAARESRTGDLQAVCLSSTTGSGKTVMLTRAIEVLLQGDEENAPLSDATFLWITDQPELNEQTRKKMIATSSVLSVDDLIVIDTSFDQELFRPGAVNFLNIQKLGKDKGLVTQGDTRTYSIWEIIKNTMDARPGRFFVVIDEAHRGMGEDRGQAEAATIIQKFIKGSPGEMPPVPVVVGISATPQRFNQLIVGTGRANRPVDVDVEDVRESGLIKDMIILHHPSKEQPTDMTMLREAARMLKKFSTVWAAYCAKQEDFTVVPLLVVQVEDASIKGQISETDIEQAIRMLRDEIGTLPSTAFAHSFQEGMKLQIGGEELRYLAPSEIQSDSEVRVVFFKTSLNTGWDCPRAEVIMSFRRAADATYIAQLVGRMVRTPLARRVLEDEVLNTVSLYLPHYDSKNLARVIARLSKPDEAIAPIDVRESGDVVELQRAPKTDKIFDALSEMPSYIVPRRRKVSQVRRLMKLARLLTNDDIDDEALSSAKAKLLSVLNEEFKNRKDTDSFNELVDGKRQIEIEAVNWDVGTDVAREGGTIKVNIASENVDDLFEATGRKLNEGLHKVWWRDHVKSKSVDRERVKLQLFALCINPDVTRKLEKVAQEIVQGWLAEHRTEIAKLDEGSRASYDEIRNLAASPELSPLAYPLTLQGSSAEDVWKKHVFVRADGKFPASLNDVEKEVVEREISSKSVVGWLRNTDRKPWALCVPYEVGGETRAMYPDFLFVRKESDRLVVDIIEPHSISLSDSPAKAAGLAKFAAKHADKFGRIELILIDGKISKQFDLVDEIVRKKLLSVQTVDHLRQIHADA